MNRRHQRIHIYLILLSRRVLDGLGPHDVVAHGGRTNRITGFLPYSTLVTAFLANKNIIRVVVFFDDQTEHELVPGQTRTCHRWLARLHLSIAPRFGASCRRPRTREALSEANSELAAWNQAQATLKTQNKGRKTRVTEMPLPCYAGCIRAVQRSETGTAFRRWYEREIMYHDDGHQNAW